ILMRSSSHLFRWRCWRIDVMLKLRLDSAWHALRSSNSFRWHCFQLYINDATGRCRLSLRWQLCLLTCLTWVWVPEASLVSCLAMPENVECLAANSFSFSQPFAGCRLGLTFRLPLSSGLRS